MILGITGSSGAGKSTVCEILERKYSSQTINADKIAKQLSKQGTNKLQEIIQNFGDDILLEDGELNRRKLEQIAKSNNNIIAIDAPLLLEANLQEICDKTIAVISEDRNLQIKRIIKRDNIDKEHAIARLNAQHPNEFYIQNCDNTLINDETLEQQIEKLLFSEN